MPGTHSLVTRIHYNIIGNTNLRSVHLLFMNTGHDHVFIHFSHLLFAWIFCLFSHCIVLFSLLHCLLLYWMLFVRYSEDTQIHVNPLPTADPCPCLNVDDSSVHSGSHSQSTLMFASILLFLFVYLMFQIKYKDDEDRCCLLFLGLTLYGHS